MVDTVRVKIGPVPAAATIAWTENTRRVVAAVRANPEKVPFAVPVTVLEDFDSYLDEWQREARDHDPFVWEGESDTARVKSLVQYWVNIDALSDDDMARLGVEWSPPEAEPFFEALVEAVIAGLAGESETAAYARNVKAALISES